MAGEQDMRDRPVLYLDLDDTIVCWASGSPEAAPGAKEFLLWALDRFEVRWLTTWAPSGDMDPKLLGDLAHMTRLPRERLEPIRGLSWEDGTKLDGVAWVEHVVRRRPFLWIEDDNIKARAMAFLEPHGFADRFIRCNVTLERDMLRRLHERLARSFD